MRVRLMVLRLKIRLLRDHARIAVHKLLWNRIVAPIALRLSKRVERLILEGKLPSSEMHPILVIPEPLFLDFGEDRDFYHER